MNYKFLTEKHDLSYGDTVTVYERNDRTFSYTGTVCRVINKKMNEYDPQSIFVDYIYVKFSTNVYNHLLKTGSNVFYKGQPRTIGEIIRNKETNDIEKIYIQYVCRPEETEIELSNINSMLIWRVAYEIVKYA